MGKSKRERGDVDKCGNEEMVLSVMRRTLRTYLANPQDCHLRIKVDFGKAANSSAAANIEMGVTKPEGFSASGKEKRSILSSHFILKPNCNSSGSATDVTSEKGAKTTPVTTPPPPARQAAGLDFQAVVRAVTPLGKSKPCCVAPRTRWDVERKQREMAKFVDLGQKDFGDAAPVQAASLHELPTGEYYAVRYDAQGGDVDYESTQHSDAPSPIAVETRVKKLTKRVHKEKEVKKEEPKVKKEEPRPMVVSEALKVIEKKKPTAAKRVPNDTWAIREKGEVSDATLSGVESLKYECASTCTEDEWAEPEPTGQAGGVEIRRDGKLFTANIQAGGVNE